jgi:hypothetical protein
MMRLIPSSRLKVLDVPSDVADVESLIRFAHTFAGYCHWESFERCAEVANRRDHDSLDALRTCLFFQARSWRHCGEDPDDEALIYWRFLVSEIRDRVQYIETGSCSWLADQIRCLPYDAPVPTGRPGYNRYTTQKDHWLGWLNPEAGTGTYLRRSGSNATARLVYNRIVEPKMLLWLAEAAGVRRDLVLQAKNAADAVTPMPSKAAAVRKLVPWALVADALIGKVRRSAA